MALMKLNVFEINAMTSKCVFCKGTKVEPGYSDCVWCDNTGTVGGLTKGDTAQVGDCGKFEAGVDVGPWAQRVVVYGDTAANAESLRDKILALMVAAQPPALDGEPVPEYFQEACDKFDWTPEQALRFYADGKHFDTENGRTRILCTGAIASHALKAIPGQYAEMKGFEAAPGGEPEVVGRQCFPSEEMKVVPGYRKEAWVDGDLRMQASQPGFYRVEPLIRLSDHRALLQAELTRMNQQFDELSAAVGFSKDRCEQTGDSPLDCAEQLKAEIERLKDNVRWKAVADEQMKVIGQLKARNAELERLLARIRGKRAACLSSYWFEEIDAALSKAAGSEQV